MEQRAGRDEVALVEHALGEHVGVHARLHPAEHARGLGREALPGLQRDLHAARPRLGQAQAHALGVAAQLALLDALRQGLLEDGRRGERGQQLGVQQPLHQALGRGEVAHPPVGREDLGEAVHVDGAAQPVQGRQARGVVGRDVAVGVVLDDVEAVPVGQLQDAVRMPRRQAVAGGVVQHAHAHEQLGRMGLAVARHHVQVRPLGAARHGQHAHAQRIEPREFHRPAGLLHHDRVAGLQQGAAHDVQGMCGADGGDDLRGFRRYAEVGQPPRERRAQSRVAPGLAIGQGTVLQRTPRGDAAHGSEHEARVFEPARRKHAGARLGLGRGLVEHAADQGGGVDVRARHRQRSGAEDRGPRGRPAWCGRGRAGGSARHRGRRPLQRIAHEEPALAPRLHEALRQQLVIGGNHGVGAHALLTRAFTHRRQPRAHRQQPAADAFRESLGELLGQGAFGRAGQHGRLSGNCVAHHTCTVHELVQLSVLAL